METSETNATPVPDLPPTLAEATLQPQDQAAIEEAITAAAEALPEKTEPVQPSIPGLQPKFDVAAALDLIEEQELAASDAEKRAAKAAEDAKADRGRRDREVAELDPGSERTAPRRALRAEGV